jgi:hypothetical protein
MNIGKEINEDVYNLVWTNIWQECRKPILDQISSLAHVNTYDPLGSKIDDTLRGDIGIGVIAVMRKEL